VSQSEQSQHAVDSATAENTAAKHPQLRRSLNRRMTRAEKWELVGIAVGIVIAVLAWWFPQAADGPKGDRKTSQTAAPPATATAPAQAGTSAGPPTTGASLSVFLDTLAPEAGRANLTALPRDLASQSGYDHPVVVACPSNQSDDQVREVTYLLRGRYVSFLATVRPYFTAQRDARTYVFAIAGYRERDGTMTRQEKGRQLSATMAAPTARLTASVDGAEELTLQVRCEEPGGVVVLASAALTL
jgi:hypothetical protein